MSQDDKIRQYVLKKQQQRERAQYLRNQRRTQPQQNHGGGGGGGAPPPPQQSFNSRGGGSFANKNGASFGNKNRIIGDPFAPTNNENIDRNNGSVYNDPSYDNHSNYNNNNNNGANNKYSSRNNSNNNDRYNNQQASNDYNSRSNYGHSTPFGKMASSENNFRDNLNRESNDDYNDYNNNNNQNNFARGAPSNNKWQTTPMPSKANREARGAFATNQSKYGQNNNAQNNNAQNAGNNYRGFNNRNNTERNNPYQQQRNRVPQYSPTPPTNNGAPPPQKEMINEVQTVQSNHSRAESIAGDVQYATADDVKKVVSMVEQLRGQMHALQFQIDNVKIENTKLKEKIVELEEKQKEQPQYNNYQQPPQNNNNYARNNNQNNNQNNNNNFNPNNAHFNNNNNRNNNNYQNARNNNHTFGQMDIDNNDHMSSGAQSGSNNANMNRNNAPNNNVNNGFASNQRSEPQIKFNFDNNNNSNGGNNNFDNNNFNKQNNQNNNNNFGGGSGFNSNYAPPNNNNFSSNNNGNRGGGGFNANNMDNEGDENEISAPPKSSAADLIAKLEQEQGAFVEPQQVERVQCKQCGRKFARQALERHTRICKKVFGQKRKAFDMKKQRGDDEAMKAQRNVDQAEVEKELKRKKAAQKAKWKAQSSMLRQAIKSSKQIEAALAAGKSLSDIPNVPSQIPDGRVPCPHCGRKFAEETAKRHIPKCQNIKSRPKALKRRR